MALVTLTQAFDEVAILPPSFDLVAAMAVVKSAKDFVRAIDRFEAEASTWQARTAMDQAELRRKIDEAAVDVPLETAWAELKPHIDRAIQATDAGLRAYGTPLDRDQRFALPLARLRRLSPDAARFFRRQIKRADAIRQKQWEAYSRFRDAMLAIQWDFDPEAHGGPGFDDAEDLIAFLHA